MVVSRPSTPTITLSGDGAKALDVPTNPTSFPLYAAKPTTKFQFNGEAYEVLRTAQIDFSDADTPTGRSIEVVPTTGGPARYLYAQDERSRWVYYEERRLDEREVASLGFKDAQRDHPFRLENGTDRYYPREEQTGTRYTGSHAERARQYIYATIGAGTQFRALQPAGGPWEVYVQEVLDRGVFTGPE